MRIRISCGLDSPSRAGFWKNDRAAVRTVRKIQYNNLLFYLLFIILYNTLHNIYNLLFITRTAITHNSNAIRPPIECPSSSDPSQSIAYATLIERSDDNALVTSSIIQSVCLVDKGAVERKVRIRNEK
jgi:hypothetical protein